MEFVCEVLSERHNLSGFDCGNASLGSWLRTAARDSDGRDITRTYVFHRGDELVVAYYALMPFFIEREGPTSKQRRGLPDRIPAYLISKLALDTRLHGKHFGSQVLASAVLRAAAAARETGGRYVLVDAIDDNAIGFYAHHGFEPIGSHPDRMVLRIKDVERHVPPG